MEEELDLLELVHMLLRRKWIILAAALVAAGIAFAYTSYGVTPVYKSETTLMVNSSKGSSLSDIAAGFDLGSINLSQKLVVTYSEIVKSRIVLEQCIERLDLPMAYGQLLGAISAQPVGSTEILKITVEAEDPGQAALIANTISDVFIKEVMRILKVNNVEIIDKAIPMPNPINVKVAMNTAIGAVLGLMLSVGGVFLAAFLDRSVKTEEDVARFLGLPVIGSIVDFEAEIEKRSRNEAELIVQNNPKSPISEAYRILRTNVQFANVDHNMKAIAVTSAAPGEGKTVTLANLAIAMAQNGHKVLVVDCDMRKPRMHKVFGVSNAKGLADILLEGGGAESCRHCIQMPGSLDLSILTAGHIPTNPSELLNSKAMKQLLAKMREQYDYVFLDTPPVTLVTDAAIISSYIDGVILVVQSGGVDKELAIRAKETLAAVGANVLGVVLNRIKTSDVRNYYAYYYYYAQEGKK